MSDLRKYGASATILFDLFQVDGIDFEPGATFATGDVKLMKDEGVEANTTNLPTDEGTGYSIVLTATEMQFARGKLYIVDQTGTKVWLDTTIKIDTYGHASAQHAFDLDDSVRGGMTALPNAAADAAGGLVISDAGALDMDLMNAAAVRLTAVRAAVLTDWINGGRLDLILDIIAVDTTTDIPALIAALNDVSTADLDAALVAIHLDHLLAVDYDPATKPGIGTALLNELIENNAGVSRYTAAALAQAPSGTGASAATIADAVWDEAQADHVAAGSFGITASEIAAIPTTAMRGTDGANTVVPPTAAQMNARTLLAADYFDPAVDAVANVTLVATTTTNTDMRGTDSALTDKAGFSLSTAGILAIWHQLVSAVVTASTMGKLVVDFLNASISSRATPAQVATELGTYDGPTKAEMDTAHGLLATVAKQDIIDTNLDLVLADTNELQTELANGGRIDLLIDLILADTGELQVDWANGGRLDLLIDAIKAKTDSLTFTKANEVDSNVQSNNGTTVLGDGGATPWGP